MFSSDDEKDDFEVKRSNLKRSISSSTSINSVLDEYSKKEAKRIGYNSNSIKVSEKWKDATFVKVIKDKLDCPLEIAKTENTASTSLDLNQSLASSNPIDLELPGGISILILTNTDYAAGTSIYKRRLARFYRAKIAPDSVVICARSPDSINYFNDVQNFCVIELGLPFIPITENLNHQITQVILQLIDISNPSKRRKNPFKFGVTPQNKTESKKKSTLTITSTEQQTIKTLCTIPNLGEKKAKQLLQKFGSIYEISNQSAETMSKVVGVTTATSVYDFLNS